MNETAEAIVALCAVIGIGLALGRLQWKGVSLSTSGVVFVALAAGHFGFQVPKIVGVAGVVLFVYCLGIGAGPSFLRMFMRQGKSLAVLAAIMIAAAGAAAWIVSWAFDLSPDLLAGLFAGALTSTPALAAASERLAPGSEVAVGFGIAYPFGVVGVILFVQLGQKLFPAASDGKDKGDSGDDDPITRVLIQIGNPNVAGKSLREVAIISRSNCQISRRLVDGKLQPIPGDFRLEIGQRVLAVGASPRLQDVVDMLGERCDDQSCLLDSEQQRRRIVATSKNVVDQKLEKLHLRSRFGVTISRIMRQDIVFVPGPQERIHFGDALTAVGESEGLERFTEFAGHRERTLDETDLIGLTFGLVLGVLLGSLELGLNGRTMALGMAGGPLLIGLIQGHLGRSVSFVRSMPRAARLLLSEIGLALFLAQAGSQAGDTFLQVVREHGVKLCLASVAILLVPLITGLLAARFVLRLRSLEAFGGICGAMTSTPGLGAAMAKTDSSLPATSYATVYPLALILVTIFAPLLISLGS